MSIDENDGALFAKTSTPSITFFYSIRKNEFYFVSKLQKNKIDDNDDDRAAAADDDDLFKNIIIYFQ